VHQRKTFNPHIFFEVSPIFLPRKNFFRRVGLAQLVRFLVVKLTYTGSNLRFDMSVVFMINYSFSGR
jgi:hypothetical protein